MAYFGNTGAKSTNFKAIELEEVDAVIIQLNDRPRKKLNFKTPANKMAEYTAKEAA